VGVEVHQVPVRPDGDDDSRDGLRILAGSLEENFQGVGGTLAQLPQEAAIPPEIHPQHLRHGEHILAMGDRGQDLIGHPGPKPENSLLMAGGTEVAAFAGEGQ